MDPRKTYELNSRCPNCDCKCKTVTEELTTSRSRILLVEPNKANRNGSTEVEQKLLVWANSAPPLRISTNCTTIDPVILGT